MSTEGSTTSNPALTWGAGGVVLGVVLTLAVQGMISAFSTKPVNTRNAIQGDTLPTVAVANRRHLITINNAYDVIPVAAGEAYTYKYVLPADAACSMQSPVVSGVIGTNSMTITPNHPWFPRKGTPVVYRLVCKPATGDAFGDSAVVVVK